MPRSKIKNPFNTLSQQALREKLCFQLDRYCMHKGESVAVFHVNDPDSIMTGYVSGDGLMYLNAGTMKLIAELLAGSNLSKNLRIYLNKVRDDLENRAQLSIPIIACFRSPSLELKPPIQVDSISSGPMISDLFKQAMP